MESNVKGEKGLVGGKGGCNLLQLVAAKRAGRWVAISMGGGRRRGKGKGEGKVRERRREGGEGLW